jgi:hypothetical protein
MEPITLSEVGIFASSELSRGSTRNYNISMHSESKDWIPSNTGARRSETHIFFYHII